MKVDPKIMAMNAGMKFFIAFRKKRIPETLILIAVVLRVLLISIVLFPNNFVETQGILSIDVIILMPILGLAMGVSAILMWFRVKEPKLVVLCIGLLLFGFTMFIPLVLSIVALVSD